MGFCLALPIFRFWPSWIDTFTRWHSSHRYVEESNRSSNGTL